jgi:hypothetical protein
LKKYFDGETSVEEEKELRKYSSTDVASHLMQYKSILDIYLAAAQEYNKNLQRCQSCSIKRIVMVINCCFSFVLLSAGMYVYVDRDVSRQDLERENPEEAMKETQRALAILSGHVNVGIESVMSLEQYEDSKINFKQ